MNTRFHRGNLVALALAACIGLCTGACASTPEPTKVEILQYSFVPSSVTIAAGTTVEWLNRDDDPHTVKSDPARGELKSPALDTNDIYRFTFKEPGMYKYFCTLHPHMQGTIIVQ